MAKLNMAANALALWAEIKHSGRNGISLRLRLFALLVCFLFAIGAGFMIILQLTGAFSSGVQESRVWMKNELSHLNGDAEENFGKISVQGIDLAQLVSESIEKDLRTAGGSIDALQSTPEHLEPLLGGQLDNLTAALKNTKVSGAFIILDATINPSLPDAASSRAGIYLKNKEPNIVHSADTSIRLLRGPFAVAREWGLELLPQWRMEFSLPEDSLFRKVVVAARGSKLPLSRLYYWSPRTRLEGDSESVMLLFVPLISKSGAVFGVCGFEVSSMLFKLAYSSDNSIYSWIFTTLSPVDGNSISMCNGLIAGNYYLTNQLMCASVRIDGGDGSFSSYQAEDGTAYTGLHTPISLYPSDSAFAQECWLLAVMMPEEDLARALEGKNNLLYFFFGLLLVLSLFAAALISRRFIAPVLHALHFIRTEDYSKAPKTKIVEIDDLLEFLSAHDEKTHSFSAPQQSIAPDSKSAPNLSAYHAFVENISTLSAAEKAVFNLYMEGYTAKDIAQILCLSMNTIKTHNRRIYMKLNVSSRKELMIYVQMMHSEQIEDREVRL